jgi:methylaspartate mutase epsilon subunit
MEVRNKRLSDEEFARQRKEVLAIWPTGKEVDLDEAVQFQKTLLPKQNYALKVAEAKKQGRPLIRIDSGVATMEGEIELFKCLQDEGGADLLGTIVDSFSRLLEFKKAGEGLKESARLGRTAINGFPIVNHGVAQTRKVIEAVKLPVQLRSPAVDTRLVLEMALASGHTSVAGGAAISLSPNTNPRRRISVTASIISGCWVNISKEEFLYLPSPGGAFLIPRPTAWVLHRVSSMFWPQRSRE